MIKILMVCLGNICRSPLAEGVLKSKLPKESFFVDSAGTSNYHIGDLPDSRSIAIAKRHGVEITNQRGRQFSVLDFDTFDIIFVMDNSNYENIIKLARNESDKNKVKLILNETYPNQNLDVPDPYYGGDSGFEDVYNMLNEASQVIAKRLMNQNN